MDKDDLEFIQDNEGKLSIDEIESILDLRIKNADENEKRILKRCDEIYEQLQTCTDVTLSQELLKEYAIISMKAERIRNRDDNAKSRCIEENKFHRTDNRL